MREKLKEKRLESGMTQNDLAEKIGLKRSSYTSIELGNRNLKIETAIKIKQALGYFDDDLFLNDVA